AAALSTRAQLAIAVRALMIGFGRAVLSFFTPPSPAPVIINPTLEIQSSRAPGLSLSGQKNTLILTATNTGPLKG
ncbi:MAG TPA: hypothetical protein VJ770_04580, partial [Stellaceae bacterium]|nr:hypothetical protein [Stellaceae bacterium]